MMTKNPVGRPKIVTSNELVETRARIVEVSENLVVSRGYGGFSMGALAKDVGITKATIYHYFPDGKDELIKAVAHEMLGRYEVAISLAIESSLTPRAQLRAIAVCIVSGHGRAERMMQEAAVFFPTAYVEELRQKFVNTIQLPIENVLRAGIEVGDFRFHDAQLMTLLLFSSLTSRQRYRAHQLTAPSEFADLVLDVFMSGIGGN